MTFKISSYILDTDLLLVSDIAGLFSQPVLYLFTLPMLSFV